MTARPCCARCRKPLRRWRGGFGLGGQGRFCSAPCAIDWAQNDEAAAEAAHTSYEEWEGTAGRRFFEPVPIEA